MLINNFNFFVFYEEYFLWNRFISCIQKNGKKSHVLRSCRKIFYNLGRFQHENAFIIFYEIMDIVKYYMEPRVSSVGNVQIPFEITVGRQYFLGIKLVVECVRILVKQKGNSFFVLLEKELLATYLHKSTITKQKSNYTKSLLKLKGKVSWRNRFLPKQEMLVVKQAGFDENIFATTSEKIFLFKNLKFYFGLIFNF